MKERIVIIDDNMNDIQLMRRVLERAGYEVVYANSGEEGLAMILRSAPHCVMVDYRMPGMDGYEVSRRIKSDDGMQNIPVLMLTGADAARNVVEGLDAGADDFVTKSSDIEVILARVRALLRVKAYQDRITEQTDQLRGLYEEVKQKSDKIMALNQRLNKDLDFARRVQEALLPERHMKFPGVEIHAAYIPSEMLSGDFYDYFFAGDRVYVFVADVSGHGLPAAILVSLLKSYLHSEAESVPSLATFMARLNDFLVTASLPSQFATAQLLRIDVRNNRAVFASAAHPPLLVYSRRQQRAAPLEAPGHLLGAIPGMAFDEHEITLESGDLVFSYTDGLLDRKTCDGEFYTLDRVAAILEKNAGDSISDLYAKIHADATEFEATEEYRDDIAFVLTKLE